jgi:hypothetical protein
MFLWEIRYHHSFVGKWKTFHLRYSYINTAVGSESASSVFELSGSRTDPKWIQAHNHSFLTALSFFNRKTRSNFDMVAHLLATATLWVRIQTFLKNTKIGDISKGVANTLSPAQKI